MKAEISLRNIKAYLQGTIRYKLYYSRFKFLIPKHIREQIDARISSMDRECYNQGQCKLCGCQTTALQMANKACDKPCYPKMISKNVWRVVKMYKEIFDGKYYWLYKDNKFHRFDTLQELITFKSGRKWESGKIIQ